MASNPSQPRWLVAAGVGEDWERLAERWDLLHVIVIPPPAAAPASFGGDGLPLIAAGTAAAVRGGDREVDVLLRVGANHEGGNVDNLLANADMTVADKDASMMDRLGEAQLEDLRLQAAFQKVGGLKSKHVIQLLLGLVEYTKTQQPAAESGSRESVCAESARAGIAHRASGGRDRKSR